MASIQVGLMGLYLPLATGTGCDISKSPGSDACDHPCPWGWGEGSSTAGVPLAMLDPRFRFSLF